MKWLLIMYVTSGYQYGITTEKFKTESECERVGSIIEKSQSSFLGSDGYYCIELREE